MHDLTEEFDAATEASRRIDLGPLGMSLGYMLRRAQIAVFADFHTRFEGEDIRPAQYSVLYVLRLNPGLRQREVSAALGVQRTNFVPLFDTLERRGFAERRRMPGDRRASALWLTPAGTELLERLDGIIAGHEAKFVARIGGEHAKLMLVGALHRLIEPAFDQSG